MIPNTRYQPPSAQLDLRPKPCRCVPAQTRSDRQAFSTKCSALATVLFLALSLVAMNAKAGERPNVVFILVDDLGYMDVGVNNSNTFYETPNIDRLAASGTNFTNGYAANPVCSPTRYSIQTGRYPSRVDATNFFSGKRSGKFAPAPLIDRMPLEEVTIAEALKQQGYHTMFAGKWHLGPSEEFWPTKQGYDFNYGGFSRGGPYGGKRYFSPYGNPRLDDGPAGEHLPIRLANETASFIEDHKDEPFFACLAFYSVHTPLMGPKELVKKYKAKAARLGLDKMEAFADEEQVWPNPKGPRKVRSLQAHAVYAAMVESMDRAVGIVLDKLDKLNLSDDTIVCLTSDNGGLSTSEGSPTSNLPLRGGKGWVYEGGIREAFIIRSPEHPNAPRSSDVPVVSIDFYPTLLDLAGIKPPTDVRLDGVSLKPLLDGQPALERDAIYWHYPHYSNQGGFPGGAIRMDQWKLVERYEDGKVNLYNLQDDPGEQNDVAGNQAARVDTMRKRLHNWYNQMDAKFLQAKSDGPTPWKP